MKRIQIALFIFMILPVFSPIQAKVGGIENLRQTGKAFASVARAVSPSVVFVQVEGRNSGGSVSGFPNPFGREWPFGDDMFKRFFGDPFPNSPGQRPPRSEHRTQGQGSGFIFATNSNLLTERSYILTNNHVVQNADKIRVKLQDGREFEAEIVGGDPKSDIAVLKIETGGLAALPLGDSSDLEVGEWVVAIGNPFGLSNTLTVGVVSAKGRTSLGISDYEDFIQTDAAINPGNSGGPLVNLNGEVVGINTAIFSRSGGYMGVGFAIPINLAKGIANQLIDRGEVTRGYLGIVIQPLTPRLAESFSIGENQGILIAQVQEKSPAAIAGLKQGDVVTAYQGIKVRDVGAFRNQVSLTPPGSTAEITVLRGGKQQVVSVTIGKLTDENLVADNGARSAGPLGITVQTLTPRLAEQFNTSAGEGVVVTEVESGSIAAMAGIEPGEIILQVNRKPVTSAAAFKREFEKSSSARRVLLLLRKGTMQRYLVLSW